MDDLSKMKKSELVKLAEELQAVKEALKNRFYNVGCYTKKQCVAVPLMHSEFRAVYDKVCDLVTENHGNHDIISGEDDDCFCELVLESDELFPQFVGVVVQYRYTRNDGTYVSHNEGIWGLLQLKK